MTEAHNAIYRALWDVGLTEPDIETEQVLAALAEDGFVIVKSNEKKLNPHQVRAIRTKHKLGDTQAELAAFYEVNPATISRIVRGYYH